MFEWKTMKNMTSEEKVLSPPPWTLKLSLVKNMFIFSCRFVVFGKYRNTVELLVWKFQKAHGIIKHKLNLLKISCETMKTSKFKPLYKNSTVTHKQDWKGLRISLPLSRYRNLCLHSKLCNYWRKRFVETGKNTTIRHGHKYSAFATIIYGWCFVEKRWSVRWRKSIKIENNNVKNFLFDV